MPVFREGARRAAHCLNNPAPGEPTLDGRLIRLNRADKPVDFRLEAWLPGLASNLDLGLRRRHLLLELLDRVRR
jgi:hypothetical protein